MSGSNEEGKKKKEIYGRYGLDKSYWLPLKLGHEFDVEKPEADAGAEEGGLACDDNTELYYSIDIEKISKRFAVSEQKHGQVDVGECRRSRFRPGQSRFHPK